MGTIRQQIVVLLQQEALDIRQISQTLAICEKEVISHLPHIAKSVAARGGRLQVLPAQCNDCGYHFKKRRKLSPPSKCPHCKSSWIQDPCYQVSGLVRIRN